MDHAGGAAVRYRADAVPGLTRGTVTAPCNAVGEAGAHQVVVEQVAAPTVTLTVSPAAASR